MTDALVVVDRSVIRRERLDELRSAFVDLAGFVRANEPRPIAYRVFLDEAGGTVTVLQIHPDPDSMIHHMQVGGPEFPRFADLLEMSSMEVYGEPGDEVLDSLRSKAAMLGRVTLTVHEPIAGFDRFGRRP